MEKFAVIYLPNNDERLVKSHPIIKFFPQRFAEKWMRFIRPKVTGVLMDKEGDENLGYIMDMPVFFIDWDNLDAKSRMAHINNLIKKLNSLDIRIICFPLANKYFSVEEVEYFKEKRIIILEGFYLRLASLLSILKQLLIILRKDIMYFNIGIWGADTEVGSIWVEALAKYVNNMCIGGKDKDKLNRQAEALIKSTGLACEVTTDMKRCLNNKHLIVAAEPIEYDYRKIRPSFLFRSYRKIESELTQDFRDSGIFILDMGWFSMPQDLSINQDLDPWEQISVLEGLLYVTSKAYREDILKNRISLIQIERLQSLYDFYKLKVHGFVQNNKQIHFDRIRMEYFRRRRKFSIEKNFLDNK